MVRNGFRSSRVGTTRIPIIPGSRTSLESPRGIVLGAAHLIPSLQWNLVYVNLVGFRIAHHWVVGFFNVQIVGVSQNGNRTSFCMVLKEHQKETTYLQRSPILRNTSPFHKESHPDSDVVAPCLEGCTSDSSKTSCNLESPYCGWTKSCITWDG